MPTVREICAALVGALAFAVLDNGLRRQGLAVTTSGHPKARGDKAFVLSVTLDFTDESSAHELLGAWRAAADWCYVNEPFLYAYEIAQSDKDPLHYVIIERYRSKADYVGAHRSSPAFRTFRPRMRALQDKGRVKVGGSSFIELGVGFT
jgi:hypothetical protein